MKRTLHVLACVALLLASCGDPDDSGTSTPVDSTNQYGTAPAEYGPDDPTKDETRYQGAEDSGLRTNTVSGQDSAEGRGPSN